MDKLITLNNESACPVSFNTALKDNQKIRLDVNSRQSVGLFMDSAYAPKQVDVVAHLPSGQQQRLENRSISAGQDVLTVCDGVTWKVPAPNPYVGASSSLVFAIQVQQQSNWCWAAVSSSVNDFYKTPTAPAITQIDLAVASFPSCNRSNPGSSACNQPNTLTNGLTLVHRFNARIPGRMAIGPIQDNIDLKRPIGVAIIKASSSVGHAVAITGYDTGTTIVPPTITVKDPAAGTTSVVDLAKFPGVMYKDYDWVQSYTTKKE